MKQRGNILIILIVITAVILGFAFYNQSKTANPPSSSQPTTAQTKTFQSKTLKFSITLDSNFAIKDTGITVVLTKDEDDIKISRNGTPFNSLTEYLKDFDSTRSLKVEQENRLNINNLDATSRIEYFATGARDSHKIYFILIPDAVYSISTNSESLYNDLDQIAKSFRYTP